MSHYDTLGVSRDADHAEIRRAYRAKASAAHPDREGGSTEAMQAINRAFEVLSDAERRAQYDATGSDTAGPAPDDQATRLVIGALERAISAGDGDWLGDARRDMDQKLQAVKAGIAEADKLIDRLARQRDRLTVKSGPNLAHQIIDHQLAQQRGLKAQAEEARAVVERALAMLLEYQDSKPKEPDAWANATAQLQAMAAAQNASQGRAWGFWR